MFVAANRPKYNTQYANKYLRLTVYQNENRFEAANSGTEEGVNPGGGGTSISR